MDTIRSHMEKMKISLLKWITVTIFYTLPSRVSRVFLFLSLLSLINKVRGDSWDITILNDDRFNKLLNLNYRDDVMILPNHTVDWFWSDDLLNKTILTKSGMYTLKDAISYKPLFKENYQLIMNTLLDNTPPSMKSKLHLKQKYSKNLIKHDFYLLALA